MWRLLLGTRGVKSLVQRLKAAATAGFEPRTVGSEVRRRNRLATAPPPFPTTFRRTKGWSQKAGFNVCTCLPDLTHLAGCEVFHNHLIRWSAMNVFAKAMRNHHNFFFEGFCSIWKLVKSYKTMLMRPAAERSLFDFSIIAKQSLCNIRTDLHQRLHVPTGATDS